MFRLVSKSEGYLFSSIDLQQRLDGLVAALRSEVDSLEANRLLNTAPADLEAYLNEKFHLDAPSLLRDQWSAVEREIQVDVRYDQRRFITDRSKPCYVPGQRIEIEVPFEGDPELFYAQGNMVSSSPPRAQVKGQSLILTFDLPHDTQHDIRPEIDRLLDDIEQHLSWLRNQVEEFNRGLPATAKQAIENRRQRILANQGRVAALGIPLKVRPDAPQTYAVPTVRRKVTPILPMATSFPYEPEPALDIATYDHILSVIQNMAQVMERSPSAFVSMGEEDLRQHFLVQLNGQFEGNATAETFNVDGKTDILFREKGRNVFIAECKFWKGPKKYRETIDQLLGYTAWRDTKTAILVFNRDAEMTTVLKGIKAETEKHTNYKRSDTWSHESGYRCILHHRGDANRELVLTILVFDVPSIKHKITA